MTKHDYQDEPEIIKPIPSFPEYSVSSHGRVFSKRGSQMKVQDSYGYEVLCLNKKKRTVHSLVAEAFIGERPDGLCVAHLDGSRNNNHYKNLKYCTYAENSQHKEAHGTKLCGENATKAVIRDYQAIALREVFKMLPRGSVNKFFDLFALNSSSVKRAIYGKSFSHIEQDLESTYEIASVLTGILPKEVCTAGVEAKNEAARYARKAEPLFVLKAMIAEAQRQAEGV